MDDTVLYVSPAGSPNGDGSFSNPFNTIIKAIDVLRGMDQSKRGRAVIYLREGIYYLEDTLLLTPMDSHLVITAYNTEDVVISGGVLVDGKWQQQGSMVLNICPQCKTAFLNNPPPHFSLFVNGSRQIVARYPNNPNPFRSIQPDGYISPAPTWLQPTATANGSVVSVESPNRNGTSQQGGMSIYYQETVGGTFASRFADGRMPGPDRSHLTLFAPNGAVYDPANFTTNKWSNPATGIVHAFQSDHWGNWQWRIESVDYGSNTLHFGQGGYQMGQGSDKGGEWFVENIMEELDAPGEFYYDPAAGLYYFPNSTDFSSNGTEVVITVLDSLIKIVGSQQQPAVDIQLIGLRLMHTSPTYLAPYVIPSGGDWAVHVGGAVYLEGTEGCQITDCTFDQVGGNGVFLYRYNRNATVAHNEFISPGDSAIVSLGVADLIDGLGGDHPFGNQIAFNLAREIGAFGKQTAFYFQGITAGTTLHGNVAFNGPRSGINFNDGFGGGNVVEHNLLFNLVRETGDHGVFNSWDREPYLTTYGDGVTPSLTPKINEIRHNFFINNYHSTWPIDHDDGSCFYYDHHNFLVYGGYKNYLGHSKTVVNNLYLYPDTVSNTTVGFKKPFCANSDSALAGDSGWDEVWSNNTCILLGSSPYEFGQCNPADLSNPPNPSTAFNIFYSPNAQVTPLLNHTLDFTCGGSELTLSQWQQAGGDKASQLFDSSTLTSDQIIKWASELIQP